MLRSSHFIQNMRYSFFSFLGLLGCALGLGACLRKPIAAFETHPSPAAPDYALLAHWAAHPDKDDPADRSPSPNAPNLQQTAPADVFYVHPTTLTGSRRYERNWNGDVNDERLNDKTDQSAILYQASLFNGAGRVYAPRYRQAHLGSFYGARTAQEREQALALAYRDVLAAFDYFVEHENNGRPFILAGHSQGGRHIMRLLRDRIEGQPLKSRMAVAYIVGWPVKTDYFSELRPCQTPFDTACFCTWRTWERKFGLRRAYETDVVCTNPIIWTTQPEYADRSLHRGAVLRRFDQVLPGICDAQTHKGILLCSKPRFPGSFFFRRKNYHIGDLNLYYMDVRHNAMTRVREALR